MNRKKYTVLVTGVGAIIGYGVIMSLRKSKYDCSIIGMDIFEDAVGQVWCDKFECAVLAADDNYIPFLKTMIDRYNVDLVFFGTEQEIQKCSSCREELGDYYNKLVINSMEAIRIAEDKWDTARFLEDSGLNFYIRGSVSCDYEEAKERFGLPLLLKPRRSYASKGICKTSSKDEFDSWKLEQGELFMVQELVGDDDHEYTASTFAFGDGTCIKPIVLRRKLSKAGATDKAIFEEIPQINQEIYSIVEVLKPIGPTNFQFRLHKGNYLLLEINPRISSATSIRSSFGYNEAEMCIEYFVEGHRPVDRRLRGGKAYRYITEVIVYDNGDNI
ncbi:ATP-grasp domain-containing protein [Butyrivibrio sp. FCS006]|uniref:ATP-grasp domain-containing protein n=1 Tax=Butyrivibrio sp. FCS006 TaxID=1280684 RepID=UPI00040D5630|nr:ATP-grasp domain-containing protein [Butyrivibrio sp. FCS006]